LKTNRNVLARKVLIITRQDQQLQERPFNPTL